MPSTRDDQRVYHSVTFGVVISMIFLGFVLMVLPSLNAFNLEHDGTWGLIFRDLGLAILISGLVGTGYELFTRQAFLGDVEQKLKEVVSRRYEELDQVRMSGLKTVHQEKFYAHVEEKFRDAKKSLGSYKHGQENFLLWGVPSSWLPRGVVRSKSCCSSQTQRRQSVEVQTWGTEKPRWRSS
jgi:hypothetical protein